MHAKVKRTHLEGARIGGGIFATRVFASKFPRVAAIHVSLTGRGHCPYRVAMNQSVFAEIIDILPTDRAFGTMSVAHEHRQLIKKPRTYRVDVSVILLRAKRQIEGASGKTDDKREDNPTGDKIREKTDRGGELL